MRGSFSSGSLFITFGGAIGNTGDDNSLTLIPRIEEIHPDVAEYISLLEMAQDTERTSLS